MQTFTFILFTYKYAMNFRVVVYLTEAYNNPEVLIRLFTLYVRF